MAYSLPANITPDLAEEWLHRANEDWMRNEFPQIQAHDDLVQQVKQAVEDAQRDSEQDE
jgi:hypothetical protein